MLGFGVTSSLQDNNQLSPGRSDDELTAKIGPGSQTRFASRSVRPGRAASTCVGRFVHPKQLFIKVGWRVRAIKTNRFKIESKIRIDLIKEKVERRFKWGVLSAVVRTSVVDRRVLAP